MGLNKHQNMFYFL